MANDYIVGKVRIVLELPDGGIPWPPVPPVPPGNPNPKSDVTIINEIIEDGVSGIDWTSDGVDKPGVGTSTLFLVYEGGA